MKTQQIKLKKGNLKLLFFISLFLATSLGGLNAQITKISTGGNVAITTDITVWQNGSTAASLAAINDGNISNIGTADYAVHPYEAAGKKITFSFLRYYDTGMLKFYNRTRCCQHRINGSKVVFKLDGHTIYEFTLNQATGNNNLIVVAPSDVTFNSVEIIFKEGTQNFREVEIYGKEEPYTKSLNFLSPASFSTARMSYYVGGGTGDFGIVVAKGNMNIEADAHLRLSATNVSIGGNMTFNDNVSSAKSFYATRDFAINGTRSMNLGTNAGFGIPVGSSQSHVFLGYNAGSKVGFDAATLIDYEDDDNTNPVTGTEYLNKHSVFVLNNSSDLTKPLLFGNFAKNNDANSMAQLAINTHHVIDSVALTVSGAVHIGPKNMDPTVFPSKEGYDDALLWVEKGIVTEDVTYAFTSNWNDWPDYVFENDYKLMDLQKLEKYIQKEKHLPGIISREEVKEEGLKSKQFITNLLVKIEELTLYTITQEKKIEAQKQLNKMLLNRLNAIDEQLKK